MSSVPSSRSVTACTVLNLANAAFLIFTGVFYYTTHTKMSLPAVLSAAYVIAFGGILACFETKFDCIRRMLYRNFSFMFSTIGRAFFFVLAGTLAFGLGVIGYVCGGCTLANMVYNMYVLCANPEYNEAVRRQHAQWELEEVGSYHHAPAPAGGDHGKARNAFEAPPSSAAGTPADGATEDIGNGWQKIWDANSQRYYYYNTVTQTVSWDAPF